MAGVADTLFFPGLFSTFFLIYGGLGFWGWGFTLMEFWACGVRPSGVLWLELFISTYKNDPGKKTLHCGQWHYVIAYSRERIGVGVGSQLLTISRLRTKTGDKVKTHCS